ncbi:TetR/AcrR family transcriptional regulator [Olsenella profusa]|uniref:Transcriptional regulator, TetR family n=1 Tax=Olsenella profusa F0195 TaxID=1125712 RepID=U2V058_9ACTN|nr:TetR/AcrR family transcriptional regulator [Olsenella profusa]ERL06071.1 transcriptional regulator, TetR family [Olsenella profusa F0195]
MQLDEDNGKVTDSSLSPRAHRRLYQILDAAYLLVGERGFGGMSLQSVANKVGITQTGVLHYVHSKDGLLRLLIEHYYDKGTAGDEYLAAHEPGGALEGQPLLIPEFCRAMVRQNARRPDMVMAFHVLDTEACSPKNSAHDFVVRRSKGAISQGSNFAWSVPEGVDAAQTFSVALAAEYGLEGRWLARQDEIDLVDEWGRYEDVLFPLPLWEGYRQLPSSAAQAASR